MLNQITPVILTYNEEANISRTLTALAWAPSIIVLDSHSTDKTAQICANFPNVKLHKRTFTYHAEQWNSAINIATDTQWVLTLDADHVVSPQLMEELSKLEPNDNIDIYSLTYEYAIHGRILSTSLYPPMNVFFRQGSAEFFQDGHTQRLRAKSALNSSSSINTLGDKPIGHLHGKVVHDDRKPYQHWLSAQHKYAALEVKKMACTPFSELSLNDKVRKIPFIAPLIIIPYMLFAKGLWRDGKAGWEYVRQRFIAEMILQKKLIFKAK